MRRMTDETVFRLVCLSVLVPAGLVRDYHWWARGYLSSGSHQPLSEIVRETRRSNRENLSSTLPLGIVASLCFTAIFAYIISPCVTAMKRTGRFFPHPSSGARTPGRG